MKKAKSPVRKAAQKFLPIMSRNLGPPITEHVWLGLPNWLESRLQRPLSGPMVGTKYAPRTSSAHAYSNIPATARHAAVMVLLFWHEGQWRLPLTLRRPDLPVHGGQVSFPGGAVEAGETSYEAAIREFREELGVEEFQPRRLGVLSPIYIERSQFRVDPWVATVPVRPPMQPSSDEVEEVLEVPLTHFLDPTNFGSHQRQYRGELYEAPHFVFGRHHIWGATCLILGELVTLVEEFLRQV